MNQINYLTSQISLYPEPTNRSSGNFERENHPMFGKMHYEESKMKMSKSKIGELNNRFGITHSEETKMKMYSAQLGEKNHMYGKHLTENTKNKISALSGTNHPMIGTTAEAETRLKK